MSFSILSYTNSSTEEGMTQEHGPLLWLIPMIPVIFHHYTHPCYLLPPFCDTATVASLAPARQRGAFGQPTCIVNGQCIGWTLAGEVVTDDETCVG